MGLLKEFTTFIQRGNVIDMAVGVIIGGVFGKIVASLVGDVLMPLLGIVTSNVSVSDWKLTVEGAVLKYGSFLQSVIDFVIIAFCVFLMVKGVNVLDRWKTKVIVTAEKPPELSAQERLLTEIRDLLKARPS